MNTPANALGSQRPGHAIDALAAGCAAAFIVILGIAAYWDRTIRVLHVFESLPFIVAVFGAFASPFPRKFHALFGGLLAPFRGPLQVELDVCPFPLSQVPQTRRFPCSRPPVLIPITIPQPIVTGHAAGGRSFVSID